jgi:hypothetical protein
MLVTPGPIISGTMGEKGATLVVSSPLAGLRKLVDSESISLAGFVGSSALSGGRRTTDYGAKKQTLFTKLPNVLILSLGRFDHLGRKITKQVEATDPLQIPDQCLTPALKTSLQGNRPTLSAAARRPPFRAIHRRRALHVVRETPGFRSVVQARRRRTGRLPPHRPRPASPPVGTQHWLHLRLRQGLIAATHRRAGVAAHACAGVVVCAEVSQGMAARLTSHGSTRTTEVADRRELRPGLTTGAKVVDTIFNPQISKQANRGSE